MPDTTPASAMFATSLARSISPRGNGGRDSALSRLMLQHRKLRSAPLAELIEFASEQNARRNQEH